MTYMLWRTRDGAGDSGLMSETHFPVYDDDGNIMDVERVDNAEPVVGASMRVGSPYARSFARQDWWQTTLITEILEAKDTEDGGRYVRFKTGNSEYEWTRF